MDRRLKIGASVILIICVVAIVLWRMFDTVQPTPDFLVYDPAGDIIGPGSPVAYFMLSFHVKNNGTAMASNVAGTVGFEYGGQWKTGSWHFVENPEIVIGVGEMFLCRAIFWGWLTIPSDRFVITVSCDEGSIRQFNVTIHQQLLWSEAHTW